MTWIAVIGEIASGKSTVCRILADSGFFVVNTGRVVASIIESSPVRDDSRPAFSGRAAELISTTQGGERLARGIHQASNASPADRVAIDGMRQLNTMGELKKLIAPERLYIAYVESSLDLAVRRFAERAKLDDLGVAAATLARHRGLPVEREITRFKEIADVRLHNSEDAAALKSQVDDLLALTADRSAPRRSDPEPWRLRPKGLIL